MSIVIGIFVVLHLLSWAVSLGLTIGGIRSRRLVPGVVHGIIGALVTGILLVGLLEMSDAEVNHIKIGVKLVLALIAAALAFIADRKEKVSGGLLGGLAALIVVNVAIAVMW